MFPSLCRSNVSVADDGCFPSLSCCWLFCAALLEMAQQEEEVGREQRRKADDAVREVKALRKELNRLKEDRTVRRSLSFV